MDDLTHMYLTEILQRGHSVLTAVDEVMSANSEEFNCAMTKLIRAVAALNQAKFELFRYQNHQKGANNENH